MRPTIEEDKKERLMDLVVSLEDKFDDFTIELENERPLTKEEEQVITNIGLLIHSLKEEIHYS